MSKEIHTPRHDALRKLLKLERVKAELSQTELAKRLGWKQATVSDIERGNKIVNVLELIAIAQALNFDPNDIIKAISKISDK
jgi:transcriptional regulator with XRE-family HTH domain